MRIKQKKIPIYSGHIVIIQLVGKEVLNDVNKSYKLGFDLFGFEGVTFRDVVEKNGYVSYVMAFEQKVNSRIIGHECFHALTYLFKDRGIEINLDNDEPAAYLLGWIIGEAHKFLKIDDSTL